jgi:hypothetical protein
VSYSLNTFMPIEGHHLAFNGKKGRIEIRQYERQAWETPEHDEILLLRNFGPAERIAVPHEPGGHFGGDPVLHRMLFKPGTPDRSTSARVLGRAPCRCSAGSPPPRACGWAGRSRSRS